MWPRSDGPRYAWPLPPPQPPRPFENQNRPSFGRHPQPWDVPPPNFDRTRPPPLMSLPTPPIFRGRPPNLTPRPPRQMPRGPRPLQALKRPNFADKSHNKIYETRGTSPPPPSSQDSAQSSTDEISANIYINNGLQVSRGTSPIKELSASESMANACVQEYLKDLNLPQMAAELTFLTCDQVPALSELLVASKKPLKAKKRSRQSVAKQIVDALVLDYLKAEGMTKLRAKLKAKLCQSEVDLQGLNLPLIVSDRIPVEVPASSSDDDDNDASMDVIIEDPPSPKTPELIDLEPDEEPVILDVRDGDASHTVGDVYGYMSSQLDAGNDVDRAVLTVLKMNFEVGSKERMFSRIWTYKSLHIQSSGIKLGDFEAAETEVILNNWRKLIKMAQVSNPFDFCVDIITTPAADVRKLPKRNVLGCFLSQGLDAYRHSTEVLDHAISECTKKDVVTGHFGPDEDAVIVKAVKENGDDRGTIIGLMKRLHRMLYHSLARRIRHLTSATDWVPEPAVQKSGAFSDDETSRLILRVFERNRKRNLDHLLEQNLLQGTLLGLRDEFQRTVASMSNLWHSTIVPVIRAHCANRLLVRPEPEILAWVIRQKPRSFKDIDVRKMCSRFPHQTSRSISVIIKSANALAKNVSGPLARKLTFALKYYLNKPFSDRKRAKRTIIATSYDKAMNSFFH